MNDENKAMSQEDNLKCIDVVAKMVDEQLRAEMPTPEPEEKRTEYHGHPRRYKGAWRW